MQQDRPDWVSRFHRTALSLVEPRACGLLVGLFGLFLFGLLGVMWVSNDRALPSVPKDNGLLVFLAIVSGASLVGSLVGLRDRRWAGWFCLLTALVSGLYSGWAQSVNPAAGNFSLARLVWGFASGSLWLALLGASWLASARAGWPPLLSWGAKDGKQADGLLPTI